MKTITLLRLVFIAMFIAALGAVAQTLTNTTELPDIAVPASKSEFWQFGIAALAPIIVWGVNKVIPKIPTVLLPTMTPVVGLGLGALLKWTVAADLTWVDAGQAGAMAVFVREVVNQAVTRQVMGDAGAKSLSSKSTESIPVK